MKISVIYPDHSNIGNERKTLVWVPSQVKLRTKAQSTACLYCFHGQTPTSLFTLFENLQIMNEAHGDSDDCSLFLNSKPKTG